MRTGWEGKELAAVSAINYGYTESASSEPVGPRFLRITDIQDDRVDWKSVPYCKIEKADLPKYRLASGDIVFARTGATTGKSFLVDKPPEAVFASYLIRLRLLDKKLLPEFLLLFFQTAGYWQSIKDGSSGSAQGGFNATKLGALTIPVPPLAEQQRIVGLLDEAFAGLATAKANAEKNLQNARALFESHLQSVFTQRGKGWMETTLEKVADANCSLSYGIVQPGHEYLDGMPIVRPTDLTTKVIRLNGLKRIDPKLAGGYKRTALYGGELLLCVRGSTGVVSIASPELVGANVTRGIVPIRFDHSLLMPEFGFYLISSAPVQSQIREKTYGAALMQINIRDLRKITLSFPALKDQKTIAAKLDELSEETQRLASLYERKLAALEALKKSLLHQAFTGEL